ncbi:MAG: fumarylacetoacetate hydrolase family protein [Rhodobacteraceae bacterium]|jgi:2-keto-4-pentenoate hydratase/2-oxohepta-3-ene-1,7-dioic acid hydratase in catechol pathway|nr:fumarylacetoacetate hydrolase family protein [Paracoccaceae bacterium]
MKLGTYRAADGTARLAAIRPEDDRLVDLTAAAPGDPALAAMLDLMRAGPAALARAQDIADAPPAAAVLPLSPQTLLAPLPVPEQIRDFSVAPRHLLHAPRGLRRLARAAGAPLTEEQVEAVAPIPPVFLRQPLYYKGNRFSCVGHGADIRWPGYSHVVDFEAEIAAYIGVSGQDITEDAAPAHIFGYSLFNDFSARDAQMAEMQGPFGPAKGKDFATGNALGPWIVTADELPDPYAVTITVRVNGEVWTEGTLGSALHRFPAMLAHVSQSEPVVAGEILGSGTMDDGCGLELGRYPVPGDTVELSAPALGTLRNRIVRTAQR